MIERNRVLVFIAMLGTGAALAGCSDTTTEGTTSSTTMKDEVGKPSGTSVGSAGSNASQMMPNGSAAAAGGSASIAMAGTPAMQPAMPAMQAGSQKPASSGSAPSTPSAGGCSAELTTATKIVMDVSWPDSIGIVGGTGKVSIWTKSTFSGANDKIMIVSQPCGTTLPELTTQAIAGGKKILPEILDATWDAPGMPKIMGTAKLAGNMMTIEPGVALIGLQMADPMGPWPAASQIMALDPDGDGAKGITAVPRTTDGFEAPPTSILQTTRTDKMYLAIRNIMTLSAQVDGCPETYSGAANVMAFDNHVIGCHIQGGADCSSEESQFVDDNSPVFKVASATFTTKKIASSATCAAVRAAIPATAM